MQSRPFLAQERTEKRPLIVECVGKLEGGSRNDARTIENFSSLRRKSVAKPDRAKIPRPSITVLARAIFYYIRVTESSVESILKYWRIGRDDEEETLFSAKRRIFRSVFVPCFSPCNYPESQGIKFLEKSRRIYIPLLRIIDRIPWQIELKPHFSIPRSSANTE